MSNMEFANRCVRPQARQGAPFLVEHSALFELEAREIFLLRKRDEILKGQISQSRRLRAMRCAHKAESKNGERARSYHQLACISAGGTYRRTTHRAAEVESV